VKEAVKFYLDEHVSHAILKALRRNGFDVVTAHDASLSGQPDVLHLEFAARKNRVLISQDDDFLRLHSSGMQHAGTACNMLEFSISLNTHPCAL
jgi:predicted nuclease of predicted toxin-antitoxin system